MSAQTICIAPHHVPDYQVLWQRLLTVPAVDRQTHEYRSHRSGRSIRPKTFTGAEQKPPSRDDGHRNTNFSFIWWLQMTHHGFHLRYATSHFGSPLHHHYAHTFLHHTSTRFVHATTISHQPGIFSAPEQKVAHHHHTTPTLLPEEGGVGRGRPSASLVSFLSCHLCLPLAIAR